MRKLLAAGYFGCGNLGDDAILLGFIEGAAPLGHDVIALSGSPEETHRNYGITSYARREKNAIRHALSECDALVFPGGSVFQDSSSAWSPIYYWTLVKEAKKLGKPVLMLGQGVGPLTTPVGKTFARRAFMTADGIAVRDPASSKTLLELGVKRPVTVAADMAWLLPPANSQQDSDQFGVAGMKTIGISARPHGKGEDTAKLIAAICRKLYDNGYVPTLVEMDQKFDFGMIQQVEKVYGGKIPSLRKVTTPMDMQRRLARMDGLIAMRLHAGILAATVNMPSVMLSYDPKVLAFANEVGLPSLAMNNLTADRVFDSFVTTMQKKAELEAQLAKRKDALIAKAKQNFEVLQQTLR